MPDRETPDQWAQLFGLTWNPSDPEIPDYQSALASNEPNPLHGFSIGNTDDGYQGHDMASWLALGMVMLQQRAVLYLRRKPGDCVGFGGSVGMTKGQAAGQFASAQAGALASGGTNVVADINAVVSQIKLFFSLLAGADAQILGERNLLCPLSIQFTNALRQIDALVQGKKADVNDALNQLQQVTQQAAQIVAQKIGSQQSGGFNTGGCYQKWIMAHYTFRTLWYPKLAGGGTSVGTAIIAGGALVAAKLGGLL